MEYIAKSGDSFWLEFDGHDAVIELAPGRYVLRQAGAQKDKTEKFEIKWDKGDGSCDPANNHIWSLSDPATWSLPSPTVILVPHDRTKEGMGQVPRGRSQQSDLWVQADHPLGAAADQLRSGRLRGGMGV